jgi:hypothetical protein
MKLALLSSHMERVDFDVHVTMHRDKFLIIKPTRCTNFSNLFLKWSSTCFWQFLCPSSGIFHCTHINGIHVCHTGLLSATYTIAVCTVENSCILGIYNFNKTPWGWHPQSAEICSRKILCIYCIYSSAYKVGFINRFNEFQIIHIILTLLTYLLHGAESFLRS